MNRKTENKIHKFKHRLIKETFLPKLEENGLTNKFKDGILEGYSKRVNLGLNQEEYAELTGISVQTIKRIELGKCYSVDMIQKYMK